MTVSPKAFPTLLIIINLCAAAVCFFSGDVRRGTYWIAASVLNACVSL